jgi:hypothetical protein
VRGLHLHLRLRFGVPSPKLDKQAPHRVIHEVLMPPNVNGVPHRRQDRDARRAERIPVASTTGSTTGGVL